MSGSPAFEPQLPPYGLVFQPPSGWTDRTYYAFAYTTRSCNFVIEARPWAGNDAAGWLEHSWHKMSPFSPLPIRSYRHARFEIRGFSLPGRSPGEPIGLRVLTLAWAGQFRSLAVDGVISDQELDRILNTFMPAGEAPLGQLEYYYALGILVPASPGWLPPLSFCYLTPGGVLTVSWEEDVRFAAQDLTPLIVEAEQISEAGSEAFDIFEYGRWVVRQLAPERLALGAHCFVAQATFHNPQHTSPRLGLALTLQMRCCADLRQVPNMRDVWPALLRDSLPLLSEGG